MQKRPEDSEEKKKKAFAMICNTLLQLSLYTINVNQLILSLKKTVLHCYPAPYGYQCKEVYFLFANVVTSCLPM